MAKVDLDELERRVADANQALSDACHIVWCHKTIEHEGCEHRPHFWSIPADPKRDVDLRIGGVLGTFPALLDELRAARESHRQLLSIMEHVHDADAPRIGTQCTLCRAYRMRGLAAIRAYDAAVKGRERHG